MKKILLAILMMAPLSMFAQKFAHYDASAIIPNMKEYIAAQTEIETLGNQLENDLKGMREELQKKFEDYQKQEANLLENVKQRRMAELQQLEQNLQQAMQDNQMAFDKAQREKLQAIQELLMAAVKKVGEAGGYVYIVDTSVGAIPYVSPTLSTDVTPEIKKALGM